MIEREKKNAGVPVTYQLDLTSGYKRFPLPTSLSALSNRIIKWFIRENERLNAHHKEEEDER